MALSINAATTVAYIDTGQQRPIVCLPSTFNIEGKIITVKDKFGNAALSNITISSIGGDLFEGAGGISRLTISKNFGFTTLIAKKGIWYNLANPTSGINEPGLSTDATHNDSPTR